LDSKLDLISTPLVVLKHRLNNK